MDTEEDSYEWLGLPTPLEMWKQHARLLENEVQELNLLLRKARADIYGLTAMLVETQAQRDEYAGYLKSKGAEAGEMRKQIRDLKISNSVSKREVETLRGMLDGFMPRPKTII